MVQASFLFREICYRYERSQPVILTSDTGFGDWGSVFAKDSVMASAELVRLLHRRVNLQILLTRRICNSKPHLACGLRSSILSTGGQDADHGPEPWTKTWDTSLLQKCSRLQVSAAVENLFLGFFAAVYC